MSAVPATAYGRIVEALRARIERGEYVAGEPLPSQRELSREFGVTLMTLRQALALLKAEGLITTRAGAGTFVVPQRFAYRLGPLRSLAQEIAAQGRHLRTRVLTAERRPADAPAAAALSLPPGAEVHVLERLRLVDGEPLVLQRSHLPVALGARLAGVDLAARSLYDVLADDLGMTVAKAHERIVATVLDATTATLLARHRGAPAVRSERLTCDPRGRPLVFDEALMPGDRLVITADRAPNELVLRFQLLDRRAA